MDAGGRAGCERADHGDLVGRRFGDLLAGLVDVDERPAKIRQGGQVDELAQYEVEGVEAVADGNREHVGPVCLFEHVGVRLDYDVTRDRQPNHRGRQDFADISVAEQLLHELDRRGLAGLQPDDRVHALLASECCHRSRVVDVAAEGPLAVDRFAGGERSGDQRSMRTPGRLQKHRLRHAPRPRWTRSERGSRSSVAHAVRGCERWRPNPAWGGHR